MTKEMAIACPNCGSLLRDGSIHEVTHHHCVGCFHEVLGELSGGSSFVITPIHGPLEALDMYWRVHVQVHGGLLDGDDFTAYEVV